MFNNALADGSFGITSPIYLDQLTPAGTLVNSLEVPNSTQNGVPPTKDQMVTSFSSKSEVALNLSTDGQYVTFMGYLAPVNALDVSNSNTPGVIDPTNPVPSAYPRVVAQLDSKGKFRFTETNAYSGNNGRAAILNAAGNVLYTAGNAGNGGNPQPNGVILGAGAQILDPQVKALVAQNPGDPTPVGSFNITQLGRHGRQDRQGHELPRADVYQQRRLLDEGKRRQRRQHRLLHRHDRERVPEHGGLACPSRTRRSRPRRSPTTPRCFRREGVTPYNMCILKGFPTNLASGKPKGSPAVKFPFGIWFANATTLYVADEGNGDNTYSTATGTYTDAAAQTTAGLQKWTFEQRNLELRLHAAVGPRTSACPTPERFVPGLSQRVTTPRPGSRGRPRTDGLRNITGQVNGDGTATIWGITSTVSGNGDQGADPNKLVIDHRQPERHHAPVGELHDDRQRRLRRGPPRRLLHAGDHTRPVEDLPQ